jgi:uncharacterized protein (DUF1330 family)
MLPCNVDRKREARMKTHYAIALAIASAITGAGLVQTLHAQGKPKAYAIVEIEVTDAAKFKPYPDGAAVIVPQSGGRFIAQGGKTFVVAGAPPKSRVNVLEWDSFEQAQAFFNSDAYKQLIPARDAGSNFRAFVVEGR